MQFYHDFCIGEQVMDSGIYHLGELGHLSLKNSLMKCFTFYFIVYLLLKSYKVNYSAQHCLMVMLEKFKQPRDKGEVFGAFLSDLSKAFDCIDHNLLRTKLSWYGATPKSLKLFFSYVTNPTQGVSINNSYSRKSDLYLKNVGLTL